MSTGQKYSGKGDSTTRRTKKGSSVEPTVNQDPQAVKPTLSVNVFSFDELIIFNGLSDAKKVVISELVNSKKYKPQQLSKVLLHIAQMPDTASLSDELTEELLESILANKSPESEVKTQPLSIEGIREYQCERINIELPFFIRWQVRDEQQTTNFLAAISALFNTFTISDLAKTMDDDLNQTLAYHAFRLSLEEIVKQAAIQRGTFKEYDNAYIATLPSLAIGDPTMAYAPAVHANPKECEDINRLHSWVETLQEMVKLYQKGNEQAEQVITKSEAVINKQDEIIEVQSNQIKQLEQTIEAGKRKEAEVEKDNSVPREKHYVDLHLYLTGGYESEVEAVRDALETASQAKLDKVLEHITVDETEDAFFVQEEYTKLQNVLARLTSNLTELALNNHNRAEFNQNRQWHLNREETHRKDWMRRKDKFVDQYSVFTRQGEESDESKDDGAFSANSDQAEY